MKKILALSALCGVVATNALAEFVYSPVTLNGHPIDHCSGPPPPGPNDCSPSGEMNAATIFCGARQQRTSSAVTYSAQEMKGNAYHWDGRQWQDLPTGAIFSSVTCR
jgi:hypothetical protein